MTPVLAGVACLNGLLSGNVTVRVRPAVRVVGVDAGWARQGLEVLFLQDGTAEVRGVGDFVFDSPLRFRRAELQARRAPLHLLPEAPLQGLPDTALGMCWRGTVACLEFPRSGIVLDPRVGSLRIGEGFVWKGGRWEGSPRLAGSGSAFRLRIAGTPARLRTGTAHLEGHAWVLGEGPHAVEWESGLRTGEVDTLQGALRIEAAEADLAAPSPLPYRLTGSAVWRRADGKAGGRFEAGMLVRDTLRWGKVRVRGASLLPEGRLLGGTLLDTLAFRFEGGTLLCGPGTRIRNEVPLLGGPGERWLRLDGELEAFREPGSGPRVRFPLQAAESLATRVATSARVRVPQRGIEVSCRFLVERDAGWGEGLRRGTGSPGGLSLRSDSCLAFLPGLRDTQGRPADTLAGPFDIRGQTFGLPPARWTVRRLWRDPQRPWLVWGFRPALRDGRVEAHGLEVSWDGGRLVPVSLPGAEARAGTGMQGAATLRLALDPGRPCGLAGGWKELGTLGFEDSVLVLGTGMVVPARWSPAGPWSSRMGGLPGRVWVGVRPELGPSGRWGCVPREDSTVFVPGEQGSEGGVHAGWLRVRRGERGWALDTLGGGEEADFLRSLLQR